MISTVKKCHKNHRITTLLQAAVKQDCSVHLFWVRALVWCVSAPWLYSQLALVSFDPLRGAETFAS